MWKEEGFRNGHAVCIPLREKRFGIIELDAYFVPLVKLPFFEKIEEMLILH